MSDGQSAVIAFLSSPLAYGLTNTNVERCETHGEIVFLADNYAYKLKRAVIFPYMDYSTSTRRRAMCEAELPVNRALAPEIYIEVRPVTRDAGIGSDSDFRSQERWQCRGFQLSGRWPP
jgi:aminoglycoside phosphotransferase family enzyme